MNQTKELIEVKEKKFDKHSPFLDETRKEKLFS